MMSNSNGWKEPTGKKSEVWKHVLVDKENDLIVKFSNSLRNSMKYFTINSSYGLTKKLSKLLIEFGAADCIPNCILKIP